jgi:aminoglycoside phosphotransferase (APT) family kinase protein
MMGPEVEAALTAWFAERLQLDAGSAVLAFEKPKTGFSADTLLVALQGRRRGVALAGDYVVRMERPGRHTFLGSSIVKQGEMMRQLRANGVPAPAVIGIEADASLAGGSFLAMERVRGHALSQHPSYHVAGFLHGLSEDERARCWLGALSVIASINRLPWCERFALLHDEAHGAPGLSSYLAWLSAWRDEACGGRPHPIVDEAIARLEREQPRDAACELLWGDSNPGNFLFTDDGGVAAVLDFEAAAIGPAEIDLSWWFFLDAMLADGEPSPAGIPGRAEQIAAFESALGRPVRDLAYYELLSAVRMALVMARLGRLLVGEGVLPSESTAWRANPAALRLAGLMGVPPDGDLGDYWALVHLMNQR